MTPDDRETSSDEDAHSPEAWLVDVTDADIRAAKQAWLAARDNGASATRVAELHQGYERLVRTQGRQIGERLRRRGGA